MPLPSLPQLTRREYLLGTATLATGAGALATQPEPARAQAQVSADSLDVADETYQSADGAPWDVWIAVSGTFSFQTQEPAQRWRVRLAVSRNGAGWSPIASFAEGADAASMTGSYDLSGRVTEHPDFNPGDFHAPLGETRETRVFARVQFAALDAADSALVEAQAADSATLSVTNTSVEATANVEGSGSLAVQAENGDDPPV